MDRYLVLLEFFSIGKKIQKYREDNGPPDDENSKIISKISNSARDILCFLLNNGSMNQRSLAKHMNISSQAVSETIKKLQKKELVEKIYGSQNNENIIRLTTIGEDIAKRLDFTIKDHANAVLGNLTDEECEQLFNLLIKIV